MKASGESGKGDRVALGSVSRDWDLGRVLRAVRARYHNVGNDRARIVPRQKDVEFVHGTDAVIPVQQCAQRRLEIGYVVRRVERPEQAQGFLHLFDREVLSEVVDPGTPFEAPSPFVNSEIEIRPRIGRRIQRKAGPEYFGLGRPVAVSVAVTPPVSVPQFRRFTSAVAKCTVTALA